MERVEGLIIATLKGTIVQVIFVKIFLALSFWTLMRKLYGQSLTFIIRTASLCVFVVKYEQKEILLRIYRASAIQVLRMWQNNARAYIALLQRTIQETQIRIFEERLK